MHFAVTQVLVFNSSFVHLLSDVDMFFKLPKPSLLIMKTKIILIII